MPFPRREHRSGAQLRARLGRALADPAPDPIAALHVTVTLDHRLRVMIFTCDP